MEKQTISILKFIRDNQHNNSITKGEVVREMMNKDICSRPTTLKQIQRLLDYKILLNDKKRNNTFSRLIINPSFNFGEVEINQLTSTIKDIQETFLDFNEETNGANTVLINNLLTSLEHFRISKKHEDKDKDKEIIRAKQRHK